MSRSWTQRGLGILNYRVLKGITSWPTDKGHEHPDKGFDKHTIEFRMNYKNGMSGTRNQSPLSLLFLLLTDT